MDLKGKQVKMKESNAKWYLDHPDVYTNGITWDAEYETETYIHLACCLGVPIYGKVLCRSIDCWLVQFKLGGRTCTYYVDRKHFTVV